MRAIIDIFSSKNIDTTIKMVLHNSKWDKKAKYKYMKKHGIKGTANKSEDLPKAGKQTRSEAESESESDLDTEDEDLINIYYPKLGGELTEEQKIKVRQQIMDELALRSNNGSSSEGEDNHDNDQQGQQDSDKNEVDGDNSKDETTVPAPIEGEREKSRRIKKLHSNTWRYKEIAFNEEEPDTYGIDFNSMIKAKDDYNDLYESKLKNRNINKITGDELLSFKIEEGTALPLKSSKSKNTIRVLTEEEKQEDVALREKIDKFKLYHDIRNKFSDKKEVKKTQVLEIQNGIESKAHRIHVESKLNKISKNSTNNDLNEDLAELLGHDLSEVGDSEMNISTGEVGIDSFLSSLSIKSSKSKDRFQAVKNFGVPEESFELHDEFLNDLLSK